MKKQEILNKINSLEAERALLIQEDKPNWARVAQIALEIIFYIIKLKFK